MGWYPANGSMERCELILRHLRLVAVDVRQGILCPVVVRIVVLVNGLRLKASDGVEFFDLGGPEPSKRAEHGALDLRDLGVLHSVYQGVLRPRRVLLELLRRVLFPERGDLRASRCGCYSRPKKRRWLDWLRDIGRWSRLLGLRSLRGVRCEA